MTRDASVDGAQGVPKGSVNVAELDCDFLAFSGHKMYAPNAIGVLYGKAALLEEMPPVFSGGGMVRRVHYIPGKRYAVNKTTAQALPGLFAKNERLACLCTGEPSPYWLVFVGAMNVCSISTVWSGEIEPGESPQQWTFAEDQAMTINKGDYFGHFNMGSTVIIIFPRETVTWNPRLRPGTGLLVGQEIGCL